MFTSHEFSLKLHLLVESCIDYVTNETYFLGHFLVTPKAIKGSQDWSLVILAVSVNL